ncbi:hypothetical protein DBW_2727 [Desulfuromonas sp. DDH964]|uniref:DUF3426 domain-containing protein n=1 Tax=Desulfuromonas sp. DDH964 TaxID=1823759 RepID=UPI00078EBD06|nr:DUF3426 domain-containing protein [Desulfuromonas sp. DDH964]AMV73038.1 hypothetical protein DBW_2727 [Desulfuromonas sp. DDH964]
MVIECSACQTRFRLADDKIKPQGTKVRCSKCGEIFTVLPPEPELTNAAAPVPEPAPATAPEPSATPPGNTETTDSFDDWSDFEATGDESPPPPPAEDEFAEFAPENTHDDGERSGAAIDEAFDFTPAAPGATADAENDEFIFVDEGEEEPTPATGGAPGVDEFAFSDEPGRAGDDLPFDEGATAASDEFDFAAGAPPAPEDFSFGAEGTEGTAPLPPLEFDSLSFDDAPPADAGNVDLAGGLGSGVNDELAFEESAEGSIADFSADGEADTFSWGESEAPAVAPDRFAFGDSAPDEFDFGGSNDFAADEAGTDDLDFSSADLAPDEPSPAAAAPAAAKPAPAAAVPPPEDDSPPRPAAVRAKPTRSKHARRKKKGGSGIFTWLLVLILLGLCGATGYYYWLGQFPDIDFLIKRFLPQETASPAASQIKVTDPSGIFVNNREAGQLFVIQGQAVNGYSEPRSALAVKGRLFNRSGALLREQTVFCGNALSENELKTLPLAKLRERTENQFGDSLSNLNVGPGKSIPFTIVFSDLPADLSEFNVEPGDSIAGSKQ